MSAAIFEQETTINIMRDEETARIYTSDTTVMTKLDKLVAREDCPDWKLVCEGYDKDGDLISKTYETKKQLISFRSSIVKRELTEEQRQILSERFKNNINNSNS